MTVTSFSLISVDWISLIRFASLLSMMLVLNTMGQC